MKELLLTRSVPVKDAMKRLEMEHGSVLFVVDEQSALIGALSDGDIRRYLMNGGSLDDDITNIYNKNPVFVDLPYNMNKVRRVMSENKIKSIPVVDRSSHIVEVLRWEDVFGDVPQTIKRKLDIPAVIMAGGKGTRLDPFTRVLPKPLVPIDNKPVIELLFDRFLEYGISTFYISVNHKSRIIKAYFEEWNPNYRIRWIEEDQPLGTAGSIKLLNGRISGDFFVSNCDVIVDTDYAAIHDYHVGKNSDITLVASVKRYDIPYGICHIEDDGSLNHILEKPEYDLLVNIGLYLVKESVLEFIPDNEHFDFTQLISAVKQAGGKVSVFPIDENQWIDVGQWEHYRNALTVMQGGTNR